MTSHRTDKIGIRLLPVTVLQIRRGDKSDDLEINFPYYTFKTYAATHHKNCLAEGS